MNKFQEEEQKFINLLLTTSEKIQPIINKIIEYTLCLKAINGLVKTGKELTVTSTNTLEEVSRMYNGNNTASYMSGCGFFTTLFLKM